VEQLELKNIIKKNINKLKDKERQVITLYYYEKLKYKEIGLLIGVSESRVSQIHTKSISKLRSQLSTEVA